MTLRMLPNKALVKPDAVLQEGSIVIPEFIQRVGRPSGILLQANTDQPWIKEAIGKRVLVRTAVMFEWENQPFYLVVCDQIMAILDGDWTISRINEVDRCQWCKSAGEGNMLTDHDGYCIRCQRNKYGAHAKDKPLTISDEEREAFGGSVEERLNKNRPTGKIFSFAGQTKRSAADVPDPKTVYGGQRFGKTIMREETKSEGRIISAASLSKRSRYNQ